MTTPLSTASAEITNNLLTGADFLDSLDDGREVWFDGERVANMA